MNAQLESMRQATLECTFCGNCQAKCPVFAELGADAACARGRLFQLRCLADGKLTETAKLAESLSRCTLCMSCAATCPAQIKTTDLFLQFRRMVGEKVPLPAAKRLAFTSLTYRSFFEFCLSLGPALQKLFFKQCEEGEGYVARLPLPVAGLNKRRIIPPLASAPLRALAPERCVPRSPIRARAVFFPGCMLNYVYPRAGRALIDVLLANGVEVLLPRQLFCCGTPVFTSGDFRTAAELAERNVAVLHKESADVVITGCATCGTALSHEYGPMLENSSAYGMWDGLKDRVRDFSAFLVELGVSDRFYPVSAKVTYHDPCHLVRGMKVSKQPRELIKAVPGVEFVEMRDADRCCGCAGSFSATHYDLSCKINDAKVKNARDSGAELLVTGCSACRMHIADGLGRNSVPMKVLHTAELLAAAYAGPEK